LVFGGGDEALGAVSADDAHLASSELVADGGDETNQLGIDAGAILFGSHHVVDLVAGVAENLVFGADDVAVPRSSVAEDLDVATSPRWFDVLLPALVVALLR